jgi:DNA replication and repair protein RecF
MLFVFDEKLCSVGAQIIYTRLRYLKKLSSDALEIYDGIAESGEKKDEKLSLRYCDENGNTYTDDLKSASETVPFIKEKLSEDIKASIDSDISTGHTCVGPHHDDILIEIGGRSARLYGSQGQQRSAVLSLKLAEARVLKDSVGEPPILLLDDVMSELDVGRQKYILNNIGDCQVFITCCEPTGLNTLEGGKIFKVDSGTITEA